ncbi:hypothetical protein KEM52_006699 [Ascosphaera acerosa]|nr:hypothetical protein KEM52_006699 [Ascosphaera acerosa]
MAGLRVRQLLEFPQGSDEHDTLINGVHLNLTTLRHFRYGYYSNQTLSNSSKCYVIFDEHRPHLSANGTWTNATSCYDPLLKVGKRGSLGVAFAALYGLSIVFTLVNLKKHGKLHIAATKRFSPVGRRWQWYWMLALAACGCISGFMAVDVDRSYVLGMAIMLQCFFFYLMVPIMLAVVWEGVRHWGAWQERQIYDADNYAFDTNDTREKQEFYLPLVFYAVTFLNFFLVIPRSWTPFQKQRSPDQADAVARPAATDSRFKAGAVVAFLSLVVILYSQCHSIYRYTAKPRNELTRFCFYPLAAPFKFTLCFALVLVRLVYGAVAAWSWHYSPARQHVGPGALYGLGYAPPLLVIAVLNVWGFLQRNEDRLLLRQRDQIALHMDGELGIDRRAAKPVWWQRMRPDYHPGFGHDANGRLRTLIANAGAGTAGAPAHRDASEAGVEVTNIEMDKIDGRQERRAS